MRFRVMTFGLAALAVLVVAGVVGATPTTAVRGHAVAAITEPTAAARTTRS